MLILLLSSKESTPRSASQRQLEETKVLKRLVCLILCLAVSFSLIGVAYAQGDSLEKLDSTPRLAIISAFDSEMELLLSEAEISKVYVLSGVSYHVGSLRGNEVVMFLSGVSMINATMTTERAVNHFNIEAIVFSGIAGGVNPNLHIGDVVVPAQFGQYLESYFARNVDGQFIPPSWWTPEYPNFGMIFPSSAEVILPGSEPDLYLPMFWFPVDPEMLEVAEKVAEAVELAQCTLDNVCLSEEPVIVVGGNGVSGQSFVDNAEFREYVWDTFQADSLEMETAAVAHVATTHGIPYLAFRSLSDLAGGGEGENEIGTFSQIAADNSAMVLLHFLEAWSER